jgi:hypothetical protein
MSALNIHAWNKNQNHDGAIPQGPMPSGVATYAKRIKAGNVTTES